MGQWLIQKESETSLIGCQASANKRNKQHRNVVAFVESLKILGFSFYYLQPQCYCHLLEWFVIASHTDRTHTLGVGRYWCEQVYIFPNPLPLPAVEAMLSED